MMSLYHSFRSTAGDVLAFVRRPKWREAGAIEIVPLFWLLILSFLTTAVFALLALPFLLSGGVEAGESLQAVSARPALSVILALVVLGPLVEEVMFRGWLTGTATAVAASLAFALVWFGGVWVAREVFDLTTGPMLLLGFGLGGFIVFSMIAGIGKGRPHHRYVSTFPILFWLQGIAFGAMHFANFTSTSIALPLLMTMPLILCGWIWGYARMRSGFGAAWILHAAYNVPVATLMIVASIMADSR